jgi:hypothetical protein
VLSGYIGEFEIVDDHRAGKIVVQLNGRLNKTGVISPRYNVGARDIEPWVNLLLPARGFGIIILVSLCARSILSTTHSIHRPPPRASSTTRRLAARTSAASSSATCTEYLHVFRHSSICICLHPCFLRCQPM